MGGTLLRQDGRIELLKRQSLLRKVRGIGGLYRIKRLLHVCLAKKSKRIAPARMCMYTGHWLSIVAVVACALMVIWGLTSIWSAFSSANALSTQIVSSHVRSLLRDHLVNIPSSDQHTVKPWLDGKLSFSPAVVDLSAQGYPLLGGRLDYIKNTEVAVIGYKHCKHIINLFVWPITQGPETDMSTEMLKGYHLVHWIEAGLNYWAISDLNLTKLQQFATLIQQHAGE
jgi:anti-sigma factor RsiW